MELPQDIPGGWESCDLENPESPRKVLKDKVRSLEALSQLLFPIKESLNRNAKLKELVY